jgi:broad specificity phosphatase PhoE
VSCRVVLVRHGSPAANHQRRFVGSTDVPIADEGRIDLARLAGGLRDLMPAKFYCSPLRRAQETARAVLGETSSELIVDPDLREVDFGHWEGMTFEEARVDDPAAVGRWAAGESDFSFPGGERLDAFVERTHSAASRLAADSADTVVAFTHGGVIRHLICHFLGLPDNRHTLLFEIRYASFTIIELYDGKGVLTGLNLPSAGRD